MVICLKKVIKFDGPSFQAQYRFSIPISILKMDDYGLDLVFLNLIIKPAKVFRINFTGMSLKLVKERWWNTWEIRKVRPLSRVISCRKLFSSIKKLGRRKLKKSYLKKVYNIRILRNIKMLRRSILKKMLRVQLKCWINSSMKFSQELPSSCINICTRIPQWSLLDKIFRPNGAYWISWVFTTLEWMWKMSRLPRLT